MTNTDTKKNESSGLSDIMMRLGILGELLAFMWRRKLYWLVPLIIFLMIFAVIIILGSTGPGAAIIYPLF